MKKIAFLILLSLALYSCTGQKESEGITLNGKMVKLIHEYVTKINATTDLAPRRWSMRDLNEYIYLENGYLDAYLFINENGDTITSEYCNSIFAVNSNIENGLIFLREGGEHNGNIGLVNIVTNEVVQPFMFSSNTLWHSGIAVVVDTNNKFGVLNNKGEFILPMGECEWVVLLNNDYLMAKKGENTSILDLKGKTLFNVSEYEELSADIGDNIFGVKKNGKWGLVDVSGKIVLPIEYDEIILDKYNAYDGLLSCIKKNEKVGFVDREGKVVIPCEYGEISFLSNYDDVICLEKEGKYGVVDFKGNIVWPFEYDEIYDGSEELLRAAKDGTKGVINKVGKWLSTEVNDYGLPKARLSGNTLNDVREDGKEGLINADGEQIVPYEYNEIDDLDRDSGLFYGTINGKRKYFNKDGKLINLYGSGSVFHKNYVISYETEKSDGLYGVYDCEGNLIIPLEYDYVKPYIDDKKDLCFALAATDTKEDFYNLSSGKLTFSTTYDLYGGDLMFNCYVFFTRGGSEPKTLFIDKSGRLMLELDGEFIPKQYK